MSVKMVGKLCGRLHSADRKKAGTKACVRKVPKKISETLLGVWYHKTGEYEDQKGERITVYGEDFRLRSR